MVTLTDGNGFIAAGLSSELMRLSAENKNLLTQKDSLYVGTGRKQIVSYGNEAVEIPVTEALNPPTDGAFVLYVDSQGGLVWGKAHAGLFADTGTYDIKTRNAAECDFATVCEEAVSAIYTSENADETIFSRMRTIGLLR